MQILGMFQLHFLRRQELFSQTMTPRTNLSFTSALSTHRKQDLFGSLLKIFYLPSESHQIKGDTFFQKKRKQVGLAQCPRWLRTYIHVVSFIKHVKERQYEGLQWVRNKCETAFKLTGLNHWVTSLELFQLVNTANWQQQIRVWTPLQ